jgi:hypothetical protein
MLTELFLSQSLSKKEGGRLPLQHLDQRLAEPRLMIDSVDFVGEQHLQHLNESGALHRIAADADRGGARVPHAWS